MGYLRYEEFYNRTRMIKSGPSKVAAKLFYEHRNKFLPDSFFVKESGLSVHQIKNCRYHLRSTYGFIIKSKLYKGVHLYKFVELKSLNVKPEKKENKPLTKLDILVNNWKKCNMLMGV